MLPKFRLAVASAFLALSSATGASAAGVIDFESETTGFKSNGYVTDDNPYVAFSDTMGADIEIGDYGTQSNGRGLAVYWVDVSKLQMDFTKNVKSLTLSFGNDDACCSSPGDRAWLAGYRDGSLVGSTSVVMNRDDAMNQTISFAGGAALDQAFFWYGDAAGDAIRLIEVVDDIEIAHVPVPASLPLLAFALAGLTAYRRRRG